MADQYRKDPKVIAGLDHRQFRGNPGRCHEPAFDNEFWDKEEAGIYVDIVSAEPLFASTKYSTAVAVGPVSQCLWSRPTLSRRRSRVTG